MRVLVTGASGFIGLHTVLALLQDGHRVRLGVRNVQKMQQLCAAHGIEAVDFAVLEITDEVAVDRALEDCDAVVHTAALVSVHPDQATLMHRTNVQGTRNVIGCALHKGIDSIVYVSSAAALFDPALTAIDDNTPLAAARSPYARSKVEAEHYVMQQIERGAKIAITYPTGVVGPQDPGISQANESLRFILRLCHINTSTGLQIIDVRDLAQAQVRLLALGASGRYLVAGHYCPWRELGQLLDEVTGRRLLKLPVPGPLLRLTGSIFDLLGGLHALDLPISKEGLDFATRWVYCDDSKLRSELDLKYRPLVTTLADTVRWLARAGHIRERWGADLPD